MPQSASTLYAKRRELLQTLKVVRNVKKNTYMSAINNSKKSEKRSNSKDIAIVGCIIAVGAVLLFAYLMWYVAPEEVVQRVKVVAVTEAGCIGETYDVYAVNIGECSVEPGEYTIAPVNEKLKDRVLLR